MGVDTCVGCFSEPADGSAALDCARVTPLERWDVDSASPAVSHRPGSRFGRQALAHPSASARADWGNFAFLYPAQLVNGREQCLTSLRCPCASGS